MHCEVLQKPLSIVRIILMVLGIISLACIMDYRGSFGFELQCPPGDTSESFGKTIDWAYPFSLTKITVPIIKCNSSSSPEPSPIIKWELVFFVNFNSEAHFFAFVAGFSSVLSFIWLIIYVSSWVQYDFDSTLTTGDIGISIAIALFWLCADCAWASALTTLQSVTGVPQLNHTVAGFTSCQHGVQCSVEDRKDESGRGTFALVMGFINCLLWFVTAVLAYRERRRITIESRGLMGATRSSSQFQPQSYQDPPTSNPAPRSSQTNFN